MVRGLSESEDRRQADPLSMPVARRVGTLAVVVTPVLLIMFDQTVLGVAIPLLTADLQPSAAQLLWAVDIYSFMLAGLLVVMGNLGDRIGRRRLLLAGTALFGIASLLTAYAPNIEVLIAARALLGVGGATLMPSTLALIKTAFPEENQRRQAIGVWSAAFAAGTALGPVLGGVLLEHFWWGSVFLLNVPLVVVLLIAGRLVLPESKDPNPGRFDLGSAVLALASMLPLVYVIKTIATHGLDPSVAIALVVGLGAGWWFIRRQQRLPDPMLDLGLLRIPAFASAAGTNLLAMLSQIGLMILVPQYLQLITGLSPLAAAAWLFPGTVLAAIAALVTTPLAQRIRPHALIVAGLALAGIGYGGLALLGISATAAIVVIGMGLGAIAISAVQTLTVDLVVETAPPERAGAASAISETGFELGVALGITILGTIAAVAYTTGLPPDVGGDTIAETLATVTDPDKAAAARTSYRNALAVSGGVAGAIMFAAAVQARVLLRPQRK